MTKEQERLKMDIGIVYETFQEVEYLRKRVNERDEEIMRLESENRRLKYEYDDSLLKRDEPMSYKWGKRGGHMMMWCPKCGMGIANWYRYCHACGQKIKDGNPLPEMEVKDED